MSPTPDLEIGWFTIAAFVEVEVVDDLVLVPEEVDLESVAVAVAVALRAALQKTFW